MMDNKKLDKLDKQENQTLSTRKQLTLLVFLLLILFFLLIPHQPHILSPHGGPKYSPQCPNHILELVAQLAKTIKPIWSPRII